MNYEHLVGLPYDEEHNCIQLMRRFYADNWGIEIRDYAHPPLWWTTHPHLDLLMKNAREEGFEFIDPHPRLMRPGDGVLFAIGCSVVNHCGAYLGNNRVLHQPFRHKSRVDLFSGQWRERAMAAVRHPLVQVPEPPPLDLMSLVPEPKKERYLAALEHARRQTEFVSGGGQGTGGAGSQ